MTTRPPIPAHPRLGTRLAYRLQRALRPRPGLRCVWVEAYERAAGQGRVTDLRLIHRPIDQRRWGESSWLNYWQGRDEGLWTSQAAGPAGGPASPAGPGVHR